MIRFIHTADIHFGMENYGKIDPTTGIHTRLLDFYRALTSCVDVAIEQKVDFFLFSGDAYKTAHPTPTQQQLLMKCFLRLYQAHIPVVIIVGNHDHPLSFGKAHSLNLFSELPLDGFHVFSQPGSITLPTNNGPIHIVGIPWPTRNTIALSTRSHHQTAAEITTYISQAVSTIIKSYAEKLDPTIPAVLAGHLTVSSGIFSGSEKRAIYGSDPVFLPSQLALAPFDYVALGHLHRYQNLNPHGYPAVVYSGSIERVDFGERKEDKGFCLVTIKEKGTTEHEFIKVPMRPFIQVDVSLSPDSNDHTEHILDALAQHTITDAVVKIMYHLPADKKDCVDIKKIQLACKDAMYLVGIIPVRATAPRARRTTMKVDMALAHLLDVYFESKEQYKTRKKELIDKAMLLEQEAEQEREMT